MKQKILSARCACPACVRRPEALIAPDCLVCAGTGLMQLGPAALNIYSPETVARAVETALETQARYSLAVPNPDLDRARRDIATMVARLQEGRLLHRDQPLPTAGPKLGEGWHWASTDEPMSPAHSVLPHWSAAFHICSLVPTLIAPPFPPITEEEQIRGWLRTIGPDGIDQGDDVEGPVDPRAVRVHTRRARHRRRSRRRG